MLRYLEDKDRSEIQRLHDRFFPEMEFIDFFNRFHCVFVVVDNREDIIALGGIRPICEAVVLTDKDRSVRRRREALLEIFEGVKYAAQKLEYSEILAFSFDQEYTNHLITKMGFKCNLDNMVLTLDVKTYG
jgi:hypothetical protein